MIVRPAARSASTLFAHRLGSAGEGPSVDGRAPARPTRTGPLKPEFRPSATLPLVTATLYQSRGGGDFLESQKFPNAEATLALEDGGALTHIREGNEVYLCRLTSAGEVAFWIPVKGYTSALRYDRERNRVWRLNYKELVAYQADTGEVEERHPLPRQDAHLQTVMSLTPDGEVILADRGKLTFLHQNRELEIGFQPSSISPLSDGSLLCATNGAPTKAVFFDREGKEVFRSERVRYDSHQKGPDGFTLIDQTDSGKNLLIRYNDSKLERLELPPGASGVSVEGDQMTVYVKEEKWGDRPAQLLRCTLSGRVLAQARWPARVSLEGLYHHNGRYFMKTASEGKFHLEAFEFEQVSNNPVQLSTVPGEPVRPKLFSIPREGLAAPCPFMPGFLNDGTLLMFTEGSIHHLSPEGKRLKQTETLTEMLEWLGPDAQLSTGEKPFPAFSYKFGDDVLRRVANEFRYADWGRHRNSVERVARTSDDCLTVRRRFQADPALGARLTQALSPPGALSSTVVELSSGERMERDERNIHLGGATFKAPADRKFGVVLPMKVDGKPLVVAATDEGLVRCWSPGDDERGFMCPAFDLGEEAVALSYSSDGRVFAVGEGGNCLTLRLPGSKFEGPEELNVGPRLTPELEFLEEGLALGDQFLPVDWD